MRRQLSDPRLVVAVVLGIAHALIVMPLTTRADDVYATFRTATDPNFNQYYGFGRFDVGNPVGPPGSASYAWTTLLAPDTPQLANLALNPTSGSMVLTYGFTGFRSITTTGSLSANLGTTPNLYGMAYDASSQLYGYATSGPDPVWLRLDPSNGQTLTTGSFLPPTFLYSSFGGNLTGKAGGGFLFAHELGGKSLYQLINAGTNATVTQTGSLAGDFFDPDVVGLVLFTSGTDTYLLQDSTLFSVDTSSAALTKLGLVTGLPQDFGRFTGAAATIATVPEPATWALALAGIAGGSWMMRRRGRVGILARAAGPPEPPATPCR